jgi:hypothetical protein
LHVGDRQFSRPRTAPPGDTLTLTTWRARNRYDPALRALVRSYEYEDWPRGRIVFDRASDLFVLYADRKLMTPNDRPHRNPVSFAGGPHRGHKRLPLSEQRDAERAMGMIPAALKDG